MFAIHLRQRLNVPVGKIVYTQWLNQDGGIEADVTITRTDHSAFMVVSACVSERRDWFWLIKHSAEFDCLITQDQDSAIIGVMGPRSTELLSVSATILSLSASSPIMNLPG